MARSVALVVTGLFFAGCGPPRWGGETAAIETAGSQTSQPTSAPKGKMTAKEFAATFETSRKCGEAASKQYDADPKKGLPLIQACVERGDYTDLPFLVEGPWRQEMIDDPKAAALLVKVVAARGGPIEQDIPISQDRRFPIMSLEDAFEEPAAAKGRLVLLRGMAKKKPKRSKSGALRVDVEEHVIDVDAQERGPQASGRTVHLSFKDLEDAPKPGQLTLFLVRFDSVEAEADTSTDLTPTTVGEDEEVTPGLSGSVQGSSARAALIASAVPAKVRR